MKQMRESEYHRLRRESLGASEVGAAIGVNPYKSPRKLWEEKVGRRETYIPESEMPIKMYLGTELEPVTCKAIERLSADDAFRVGGYENVKHRVEFDENFGEENMIELVDDNGKRIRTLYLFQHSDYPFITATPDRRYRIIGEDDTVLEEGYAELKFVGEINNNNFKGYLAQMAQQKAVTGAENVRLFAFEHSNLYGRNAIKECFYAPNIEITDEIIEETIGGAVDFWKNYVEKKTPPPLTDVDNAKDIWSSSTKGKFVDVGDDIVGKFKEYISLNREISVIEDGLKRKKKLVDKLMNEMQEAMADAEEMRHDGMTLATWRTVKGRSSVDTKLLKQSLPADEYEKYLKQGHDYRRFVPNKKAMEALGGVII